MLGTVGENCSLEYAEKLDRPRGAGSRSRRPGAGADRRRRVHDRARLPLRRRRREARRRRPDGAAGDGLQGRRARDDGPLPRRGDGAAALPIMSTTTRVAYGVDITPEMFAELADEPKFVAIKESSENVRRITDLKNLLRRPLPAVLRRRRPGAGKRHARRGRLGVRAGQRLSGREPAAVGPGDGGPLGGGARGLSLVHAAAAPRHARQAGAVHQAGDGRVRPRLGDDPRAAAAARRREERERVLGVIRKAIATRPARQRCGRSEGEVASAATTSSLLDGSDTGGRRKYFGAGRGISQRSSSDSPSR